MVAGNKIELLLERNSAWYARINDDAIDNGHLYRRFISTLDKHPPVYIRPDVSVVQRMQMVVSE